jgi:hypothetical protein
VALFKKRQPEDVITPFWDWWNDEGRERAESHLTTGATFDPPLEPIGPLRWDIAPGNESLHLLVVTADGNAEARPAARRLMLAAPPADDAWGYTDLWPGVPDVESVVLPLAGELIALERTVVSARMSGASLDLQFHHPIMGELTEQSWPELAAQTLIATLGEADAEMWFSSVTPVNTPPLDGFGLTALRSVVHDLKRQRLAADGLPTWVMLRGETSAGPLLAMVRSPLHPLTAPHLDTYVSVAVPYRDQTDGLPGTEALEPLRTLEHRLGARLGNDGQVVAHLSTGGVRTFHLYVDSTADMLPTVKDVARAWDQGKATVHDMHDPGWQAVGHLRQ